MKLWDIAHSRTGDKGDISNVSLIAYDPKDYAMLCEKVTAEKVKEHFKGIVKGEVVRYELPNIHALNFVMYAALGGGVTRSLSVDTARACPPICWTWTSEFFPRSSRKSRFSPSLPGRHAFPPSRASPLYDIPITIKIEEAMYP